MVYFVYHAFDTLTGTKSSDYVDNSRMAEEGISV